MSAYQQILDNIVAIIPTFGFMMGGGPVPAFLRKLPAARQGFDPANGFYVCRGQQGEPKRERLFSTTFNLYYPVIIELIGPGNLDLLANEATNISWQETLSNRLEDPKSLGLDYIQNVAVDQVSPGDAGLLLQGVEAQAIKLTYMTLESH